MFCLKNFEKSGQKCSIVTKNAKHTLNFPFVFGILHFNFCATTL